MIIYQIDRNKGYIKIGIENDDDLWILAMILSEGDLVTSKTTRDVSIDGSSKRRMPMTLTIKVTGLEFQAFSGRLRVRGIIVHGPEKYGLKGSYHTLSLGIGSVVEILKSEGKVSGWIISRLKHSGEKGRKALLIALDYDEYAVAVLQGQGTKIVLEGSFTTISKRDQGSHTQFIDELSKLAEKIVEISSRYNPYTVIIGSPGELKKKLKDKLEKNIKINIYIDTVSIGGRAGIDELIRRGVVKEVLNQYSIIEAQKVLEEFLKKASNDPEMVSSGIEKVKDASEMGAVEKIVILDELLRSDLETRKIVDDIMHNVDRNRGQIILVSSESDVGSKIKMLGGVIAIHRFKIYSNY